MVQAKEAHGEGPHEPGSSQDPPAGGLAGLVCSLGAIGHALQEAFDPQRFLKEFSAHVQRLLPHDRLMIAYLEDEGRTFTVFAEYAAVGPLLHEGHYTIAFGPGDEVKDALMGHGGKGSVGRSYGLGVPVAVLAKAMGKVD